ncbi:hypothetical protein O181_024494 [Austropuccinia psidii MF-1]|uniref:Uncharacterized protein n=1 Tax=Austropuccinia psidii MF-1 TaxID=1389203 RepID=A0A9Q3GZQ8_9BASI|nr:hypothetical protein [Austropuccinia psidii MF-1]
MSPVCLRNLGIPRNQTEDKKGLLKTRGPGSGSHSGMQDTEGNHTHTAIHLLIQQRPQHRRLEGYGSSYSAPPAPQRFITIEDEQQEVRPSFTLGRTWSRLPEDISQRGTLQRSYGNHNRQFKLLEEMAARIWNNKSTSQAIEEQLNQK